ncbi:MAG: trimethylamine methyltransferase family protein [Bacillota bacterium]
MTKFGYENSSPLSLLKAADVKNIHQTALKILSEIGVLFENGEALEILATAGCDVDFDSKIVKYDEKIVLDAIEKSPEHFALYDREGVNKIVVGGSNTEITPTFSASNILLSQDGDIRPAVVRDMKDIINLTNQIEEYHLMIPAVVCSDIPPEHGDYYRDYLMLKYSSLPMATEAWSIESLHRLFKLLVAVRGTEEELAEKPLTIVGLCPMAPLTWSNEASQNVINAARCGIPVNICACPMLGSGSSVTVAGAVAQQAAEFLSGLVLMQTVKPGAPAVFGGYSTSMDMKTMTASVAAMEAVMAVAAHAAMAKFYGVPSQTFAECSEAKTPDFQSGWETAMTGLVAAASGINLIYGCGSLDYLMEFSYEKFLIDAEIAKYLYFLHRGVAVDENTLAFDTVKEVGPNNSFMMSMHTMMNFRNAQCYPAKFIDRNKRGAWESNNRLNVVDAAKPFLTEMLEKDALQPADKKISSALDNVIKELNDKNGTDLPLA